MGDGIKHWPQHIIQHYAGMETNMGEKLYNKL
jgi:hypothetical protein